ncbi:hypothetical protein Tco_0648822 [Tanacetum coccineum]
MEKIRHGLKGPEPPFWTTKKRKTVFVDSLTGFPLCCVIIDDESESEEGKPDAKKEVKETKKEEKQVAANKKDLIRMSVFSDVLNLTRIRVNGIADTSIPNFVLAKHADERWK